MKDMCSCKCKDMGAFTGTFSECYDSSGNHQDDEALKDGQLKNAMECGDTTMSTTKLCS